MYKMLVTESSNTCSTFSVHINILLQVFPTFFIFCVSDTVYSFACIDELLSRFIRIVKKYTGNFRVSFIIS